MDKYFRGFVMSIDVGARKPDPVIFQYLLRQLNVSAADAVFMDDQLKNVDSAAELGFTTIIFDAGDTIVSNFRHELVRSFYDLLSRLS